ncbi:MAG: hypothetical protein IJN75_04945 [Clostridia bacterium]|nr:hypothetical protein [Clostridia bacterium]
MKRYLAMFLALLMLVFCFAACDNEKQESKPEQTTSTDASADTSGEEEMRYTANVPDVKYDGEEFVILTSYVSESVKRPEFGGTGDEEIVEDVVNTAIKTRNEIVEEKLDIDILELKIVDTNRAGAGATYAKISTALSGGALDFHMASPSLFNSATLAQGGYLEDLMQLEYLHELSESWWHKYFTDGVSLFGRVYYASGDISFYNLNTTTAMLFNKELFDEYQIEAPYQLVKDKKWTLDKLREIQTIGFSSDLDANGVIDYNDRVAITASNDMMWAQFFSCGGRIISKDGEGEPYLSIWSESNDNYITKIVELMQDKQNIILADDYFSVSQSPSTLVGDVFRSGRSLIHVGSIAMIDTTSEMSQEFGVLPYPLYDENQEDYYSFLSPWVGVAVCIPFGYDDETLEYISIVMETMGAEGKNEIIPQFYEVVLKRQKTRDDESQEMLDIISSTAGCDFGQIANVAEYPAMLHQLIKAEAGTFFSKYEALKSRAENEIQNIINAYSK